MATESAKSKITKFEMRNFDCETGIASLVRDFRQLEEERNELKQQVTELSLARDKLEDIARVNKLDAIGYQQQVVEVQEERDQLKQGFADALMGIGMIVARLADSSVIDFPSSFDELREALDKLEEVNHE